MAANHYRTLNVSPDATPEQIQKSYRALARRYHPDVNPTGAAVMAAIHAAYEVLGEPSKRAAYDRSNHQKERNPAVNDVVLSAARDRLLRQDWTVVENKPNEFVLRKQSRTVHVALMRT